MVGCVLLNLISAPTYPQQFMDTTFKSQLWKRQEDREGEITLILKIPLSDAEAVKKIPVLTELTVAVVWE